jgi:hypothetical protein
MEIIEFTAPASWASALINGDDSGMDEAECLGVRACIDDLVAKHGSAFVCDCSEPEFQWRGGDYGSLAGDYCTYTMTV